MWCVQEKSALTSDQTVLLISSVVCPEMLRGFLSCLYCSILEVFRSPFSAQCVHAQNIPGPTLFMLK